jgi:hypothetical protein
MPHLPEDTALVFAAGTTLRRSSSSSSDEDDTKSNPNMLGDAIMAPITFNLGRSTANEGMTAAEETMSMMQQAK